MTTTHSNLKLLIAEDEITTRKGLLHHIEWKSFGITDIQEATNGQEAIELLDLFQPDLLITDIRMPLMNGIELATQVKEKYPKCKVIFLSGYSDKEYLKAAIHLGVIDYVEKPIDIMELEEAIGRAVELHEDEVNRQLENAWSETSKQALIDQLIRKNNHAQVHLEKLRNMGFFIDERTPLAVLLIKMSSAQKNESIQEVFKQIESIILEQLKSESVLGSIKDQHHILWVLSLNESNYVKAITRIFYELDTVNKGLAQHLFFSIGGPVAGIERIYESYQTAVVQLQNLFIKGYGNVSCYNKTQVSSSISSETILKEFKEILCEADPDQIWEYIHTLFLKLHWQENLLVNDMKNIFFQMCLELYREGERRISYQRDVGADNEPYLWENFFQMETLSQLKVFMEGEVKTVLAAIHTNGTYCKSIVIVKRMIESQYMNLDLSTNYLAERVFLTNTYLSSLFKKEVGMTIRDYISQVRIEASKELLKDNKLKLWEVAFRVGYTDPNHYAKTFKKNVGVTPSEFREKQWL